MRVTQEARKERLSNRWGQAGELVLRQVAANRAKKAALASQLASEGRSSKRSGTPAGSSSRARELSSAGGGGGRRGGRGGVSARVRPDHRFSITPADSSLLLKRPPQRLKRRSQSLSPSPRGDMAPAGADTVTQSSEELSQALKVRVPRSAAAKSDHSFRRSVGPLLLSSTSIDPEMIPRRNTPPPPPPPPPLFPAPLYPRPFGRRQMRPWTL